MLLQSKRCADTHYENAEVHQHGSTNGTYERPNHGFIDGQPAAEKSSKNFCNKKFI